MAEQKIEYKEVVVDAKDMVLGRMASGVAKLLRSGHAVHLINCEHAVISGNKRTTLEHNFRDRDHGSALTGPYISRRCDQFVKRVIRGMMPYRKPSGLAAFRRLRCYVGSPSELATKEKIAGVGRSKTELVRARYVSVGEVCKWLGGK